MSRVISQAMNGPAPSGDDYRLAMQLLQQGSHGYLSSDSVRRVCLLLYASFCHESTSALQVQVKLVRGLMILPLNVLRAAISMMDDAEATVRLQLQATAQQAQEMKSRLVYFCEVNHAFSPDPDDKRQQESDNSIIVDGIKTTHSHLLSACDAITFMNSKVKAVLNAHYLATHRASPPPILSSTTQKLLPLMETKRGLEINSSPSSDIEDLPTSLYRPRGLDGLLKQADRNVGDASTQGDEAESEAETITSQSSASSGGFSESNLSVS
jgi:hypothetical protein